MSQVISSSQINKFYDHLLGITGSLEHAKTDQIYQLDGMAVELTAAIAIEKDKRLKQKDFEMHNPGDPDVPAGTYTPKPKDEEDKPDHHSV